MKHILVLILISLVIACEQPPVNDQPKNDGKNQPVNSDSESTPAEQSTSNSGNTLGDINTKSMEVIAPGDVSKPAEGVLTQIRLVYPVVLNVNGSVEIKNNAPLEGFPVGESIVTWTVTNSTGEIQQVMQHVTIFVEVACTQEQAVFTSQVWPTLETRCITCHSENKITSNFNLVASGNPDYLRLNFLEFQNISPLQDSSGLSLLLSKPGNVNNDHGGGEVLAPGSVELQRISQMIQTIEQCFNTNVSSSKLKVLPLPAQLRKTTLALAARLPKQKEFDDINNAINEVQAKKRFDQIILDLMEEANFYQRLKEIFNDVLLTDAYKNGSHALNLNLNDFDNRGYFATAALQENGYSKAQADVIRSHANYGVSQSPLELIVYIVLNNLPFTEIVSADYLMVNPYSAKLFNATPVGEPGFAFHYGDNPDNFNPAVFRPVKVFDNKSRAIPHAGILTTIPFLNRYPSSNTNLNRKRAKIVFSYFLDTDVEGLAHRSALDLNKLISDYPALHDPQCKICHDVIDPVAGLFKNWANTSRFLGDNQNWLNRKNPPEMLAPGYGNEIADLLPTDQSATALQWLGQRIGQDNRFASAMVKTVFAGFTGIEDLDDPGFIQSMKNIFILSNYDLKTLIREIVRSNYFLADTDNNELADLNDLNKGTAHLLTPEQLHRKIMAIFAGYTWQSPGGRSLMDEASFRLLYGGIDSNDVTSRTTKVTSIMSEIQLRIASQLACEVVAKDFILPANARNLFPFVEISDDSATPDATTRIKKNIQFLFEKILGDQLTVDDTELNRAYGLFANVVTRSDGTNIAPECIAGLSPNSPIALDQKKTVRAWMAIINYLVRDYRFLYE